MAQVTIYLDADAERRLKAAGQKAGVFVSRWLGELVRNRTRTDWPAEARELAGAWPHIPDLHDIRAVAGKDHPPGRHNQKALPSFRSIGIAKGELLHWC